MKKQEFKQVLLRVPAPLLKRVDAAAKEQRRTRTAEVCVRLAESLKKRKSAIGGVVGAESMDGMG